MSTDITTMLAALKAATAAGEGVAEAITAAVAVIEDGIYFGLPDVVYHSVPRLSASGLQKLCVSPATFWASSWLCPDRPEVDEEQTKAQQLGKAYHTARLEPELFDGLYVRALEKEDMPKGTLLTGADMGKALEELGLKKTGSVGEQAQRLVDDGYEGTIWHVELAKWEAARGGRIALPGKYFDQIVTDMERIRGSGEIAELLSGGAAEVSIFWTDAHGLKMRSRVDYLTAAHWADMKTFSNPNGKELEQALADAVRFSRYYVQAVVYRDAIEAIRLGQVQIIGKASDAQRKIIAAIQIKPGEMRCWYVFQETKGVPNILAREFKFHAVPQNTEVHDAIGDEEGVARQHAATNTRTALHSRAAWEIDRAKRAFALYSEVYKPGTPWFPIEPRGTFDDLSFNSYWLEGR